MGKYIISTRYLHYKDFSQYLGIENHLFRKIRTISIWILLPQKKILGIRQVLNRTSTTVWLRETGKQTE